MTNICERRTVYGRECEASRSLAAFFAAHREADGTYRFGFSLSTSTNAAFVSLVKRIGAVSLYSLKWIGDRHPTYSVTWSAKVMCPSPLFVGALAVEALESDDAFGLILSGIYQAPFGKMGSLFDALLGPRIAEVCARGVLRSIADHVEHPRSIEPGARASQK